MQSYVVQLFNKMEVLYENIYNLLDGFQRAAASTSEIDIEVTLLDENRQSRTVNVSSFKNLQAQINRIQNNFNSLTNENNISYILNGDGTLSSYHKTSFINSDYINLSDISINNNCLVDKKTMIADFLSPLVKIPITIDQSIKSNIICRSYNITTGYNLINDNPSLLELKNLINTGTVVSDSEIVRELVPEKEQVKYFGSFTIISFTENSTEANYTVVLNDIHYGSLNTNGNTIELLEGDELVTDTGMTRFQIESISLSTNTLVLIKLTDSGEQITTSTKLLYNQQITGDDTIVGIPVKPTQNLVIFLSTENTNAIGYPSLGIKISTENYNVSYEGVTYTIDEFFSNYVTNISDYLLSIAEDNNIPNSMGVVPNKPELLSSNFKVLHINKHITNSKSVAEINTLNAKKNSIQNQISEKMVEINNKKSAIENNTVSTIKEKINYQSTITSLYKDINNLESELLVISRRIDNDANDSSLKTNKPKYKIVGFWSLQNNLYSVYTGIQHIIKYEVQYRYLNNATDNVDTTTLTMVDNGQEVSVTFSPWNTADTNTLGKTKDINGKFIWETQSNTNSDDLNINQCMIPIQETESVEIRIRAISEAGYPINPVKSEWSNILKVVFPEELKVNNITSVIETNEIDLRNSEFTKILSDKGVLAHMESQVTDAEKTYHHTSDYITSGLYTAEMKNISLTEAIRDLKSQIEDLKTYKSNTPTITVEYGDDSYVISNDQLLSIYLGSFTEEYDISNSDNFGLINKKKINLKISNNNNIPIELRSINPQSELDDIYDKVPVLNKNDELGANIMKQLSGQVIYFRSKDMSLLSNSIADLYDYDSSINLPTSVINNDTTYPVFGLLNQNIIQQYAPLDSGEYILYSRETPNITQSDFKNLSTRVINKTKQISREWYVNNNCKYIGFDDKMKYSIGYYSCGSFLYPVMPNNILVKGDTASSSLILSAGASITIPIIYEYRFIDNIGRIMGSVNEQYESKQYKKLGITMLISNQPFTFDLEAYMTV